MNLIAPVSSIMSQSNNTVSPQDSLILVKNFFDSYKKSHLMVVQNNKIVGMVSASDFKVFCHLLARRNKDSWATILEKHKVSEIMIRQNQKVESTDRISDALEIFNQSQNTALAVVSADDKLVGTISHADILTALSKMQSHQMNAFVIV
jgi:acetoin utilization protein AcuB